VNDFAVNRFLLFPIKMEKEGENHSLFKLKPSKEKIRMRATTSVSPSNNPSNQNELSTPQPLRPALRVSSSNLSSHMQLDIVQHIKLSETNVQKSHANDDGEDYKFGASSDQAKKGNVDNTKNINCIRL
jgi:hypothetical protein